MITAGGSMATTMYKEIFDAGDYFDALCYGEGELPLLGLLKAIIKEDNKRIIIKKTGLGNTIYDFAHKHPSFYGIVSIIFAIISGIVAATAFRRL